MRSGSRSMWRASWARKLRGETLRRCALIPMKRNLNLISVTTLLHLTIVYRQLLSMYTSRASGDVHVAESSCGL